MAGSRRSLKKNAVKVKVGVIKRKKSQKTKQPTEINQARTAMAEKMQLTPDWTATNTLHENYRANKLLLDPNAGFGRNVTAEKLQSAEQRAEQGEKTFEDDDELRAANNLERKTGRAPPPRLTTHQRAIVERLRAFHGDDLKAMVLDRKLNPMQHSSGQLAALIRGFDHWGGNSKHDFRGPNKPYKKL